MPQLVEHIDKIARNKGGAALYIVFDKAIFSGYDYESWSIRHEIVEWFEKNDIKTSPCAHMARSMAMSLIEAVLY